MDMFPYRCRLFYPAWRWYATWLVAAMSIGTVSTNVADAQARLPQGSDRSRVKLSVGPGKPYATPCQAFAAARDGDVVEIDARVRYTGDVCVIRASGLVIRGIHGRPKIDAAGRSAQGKGLWVIEGSQTRIDNVALSGTRAPHRNGAAIWLTGRDLTVRHSTFHDNENGILVSNDGVSDIVIEHSEFAHNGHGDGYSHNLYVGRVNSLAFQFNYSHDAHVGHNLKSRARTNFIAYNRFSSATSDRPGQRLGGRPSYEIDLPDGGTSYVIGNVIQQPALNHNPSMIAYGAEHVQYPDQDLYVVNNTFLNDGDRDGHFIFIGAAIDTPALIQNNVFAGIGSVTNQPRARHITNYQAAAPTFINRRAYDLRPAPGAAFIATGSMPGRSAQGLSLVPTQHYVHPAKRQPRQPRRFLDIGAYDASDRRRTDLPDHGINRPRLPHSRMP